MENKENTPNPEQENLPVQEEIPSTVELTETITEQNLPTEVVPTDEMKTPASEQQETEDKPESEVPESEPVQEPVEEPVEEPVNETSSGPEEVPAEEPAKEPAQEPAEEPVKTEEPEPAAVLVELTPVHEDDLADDIADHEIHEADQDYDHYTRAELVDLLQKTVSEEDISSVKTRIALIKVTFMKKTKEENLVRYEKLDEEGVAKEELETRPDELEEKFNEIFNIYRANKIRFNEEQEKVKKDNLVKKMHILEELKSLISSEETLKKTYDEFKLLQERWKEIGIVPRGEINNLWQNYHFLVEKFFEKVKLNKELKDLDLRKNLEAKIALCEKTEELLLETSIIKSFKQLQKYHEDWKEIGPVPVDKKDEIWERFKTATDKINERRREYYTRIEDEQQKNYETKIALCEQADEIVASRNESTREWQDNTNKVNELLKIWKSVGPVPQKFNAAIWSRFKSGLDAFFASKKEFFDRLKEQQMHNFNLKVDLCIQAETIKNSTDWKKTTSELIHLQEEWRKIGPVPRKHSDKIWKRFRSACDEFFTAKSSYFSNIHSSEAENLAKKEELMERLKAHEFGGDKNANLEVLKNFQREWMEIGFVPIKERNRLQNDFRTLINERLDKLKISEMEISTVDYQARMDHMKNDPQSRRLIGREKEQLMNRISKMKEDINLWENNIGFLASSKNADILKAEFLKKIDRAKSELKVMEAKLKILKQ